MSNDTEVTLVCSPEMANRFAQAAADRHDAMIVLKLRLETDPSLKKLLEVYRNPEDIKTIEQIARYNTILHESNDDLRKTTYAQNREIFLLQKQVEEMKEYKEDVVQDLKDQIEELKFALMLKEVS